MAREPKRASALGQKLRARRKGLGLTFRQVTERSGGLVSNPYLCQIETGRVTDPGLLQLMALAKALDITIEQIAEWRRMKWERPRCLHCGQEIEEELE